MHTSLSSHDSIVTSHDIPRLYANEKQEEVLELPSSYEVKGIVGNDRRHYALDLFRIFPPDANYMDVSEGSKVRHRMAVLRPELVETFHKSVLLCVFVYI